jgi:hypothetical protein
VHPKDEDEVWRDIVENYGDAPTVEEAAPVIDPVVDQGSLSFVIPSRDEDYDPDPWEDEGHFVPPPAPPVPLAEPPRLLAWIGLFGSPAVLLVSLMFSVELPSWLSTLMIGSFIGGFGYLVATMNREPRDPGDDGARI